MREKSITLPRLVVAYKKNSGSSSARRSVWLSVPSAKLAVHLAISGAPDPGFDGVGFAASTSSFSTWQLTPYVPASDNGTQRPSPLQPIFADTSGELPQLLPSGYEIQSSVRLWRARLTLRLGAFTYVDDNGNTITQAAPTGAVVATATVEPAPDACFADGEYTELVAGCKLWLDGSPPDML